MRAMIVGAAMAALVLAGGAPARRRADGLQQDRDQDDEDRRQLLHARRAAGRHDRRAGRTRRRVHGRRAVRAADREDRRGDQADLSRRPHPLPGQHARPRRPHRRQRELGKLGVTILARENCAAAREAGAGANGQPGLPRRRALPVVTYDAPVTIHMNGEDVQLIPVPAAHTDGDTMVYFPNAERAHDGRLLPLARLSEHRPRQRRLAEGHARRASTRSSSSPGPTRRSFPATARSWTRPRSRRTGDDRGRSRQGRARWSGRARRRKKWSRRS